MRPENKKRPKTKRSEKQTMRLKMLLVALIFCVICSSVIIGRLAYMQIINYDFYEKEARHRQTRSVLLNPSRGTIYETNGKPLAVSADTEMLILNPRQLNPKKLADLGKIERKELGISRNEEDRDLTEAERKLISSRRTSLVAETLPTMLELDEEKFQKQMAKDSAYQVLKRGVERDQANPIRSFISENQLGSVLYFLDDSTRYYPYGNFLSHVLGCVGADEQGLTGLEKEYDELLTGTPGRRVALTDRDGNALTEDYEIYCPPEDGKSLVLTIDEVLQHFLEKNLEIAYHDNGVQGSAIGLVMDVNEGGVLAMASYPDFDPNEPFQLTDPRKISEVAAIADPEARKKAQSEAVYEQWSNKCVSFMYYPGSTFKTITMAAALEEGVVNQNSTFYCPGFKKVDGYPKPIHCWKRQGHGDETLVEVMMNSCNPAIMTIGLDLGKDRFGEYVKAFGMREKTGIDLPGEAVGLFNLKSNVDLAVYSFGQNFSITPLQMITAVSAVANGGTLLQPHIVKEVLNPDGSVAQRFGRKEVRQVISEKTSLQMRDMLEAVVTKGTGKNAYVAGYRVAGKTGTTEKIADMNQTGESKLYVTSFVAFAPADNPQIAVLILLDVPTVGKLSGGINTAPVVRRFMEEALPYLEIDPLYTEEEQHTRSVVMPDLVGMTYSEAEKLLKKSGMTCTSVGSGSKITDQVPANGAMVASNTRAILYLDQPKPEKTVTVPDLNGMTLAKAGKKLQDLGLYILVSGGVNESTQTVTKQDIQAASEVAFGSVITVETTDMSQQSH